MRSERPSATRQSLELALRHLKRKLANNGEERISIAAVAREAGVSNATIHNRYPDIAERVRALQVATGGSRPKMMPDTSDAPHRKLREVRQEVERLKADLAKSQSINLRLIKENELLQARLKRHR